MATPLSANSTPRVDQNPPVQGGQLPIPAAGQAQAVAQAVGQAANPPNLGGVPGAGGAGDGARGLAGHHSVTPLAPPSGQLTISPKIAQILKDKDKKDYNSIKVLSDVMNDLKDNGIKLDDIKLTKKEQTTVEQRYDKEGNKTKFFNVTVTYVVKVKGMEPPIEITQKYSPEVEGEKNAVVAVLYHANMVMDMANHETGMTKLFVSPEDLAFVARALASDNACLNFESKKGGDLSTSKLVDYRVTNKDGQSSIAYKMPVDQNKERFAHLEGKSKIVKDVDQDTLVNSDYVRYASELSASVSQEGFEYDDSMAFTQAFANSSDKALDTHIRDIVNDFNAAEEKFKEKEKEFYKTGWFTRKHTINEEKKVDSEGYENEEEQFTILKQKFYEHKELYDKDNEASWPYIESYLNIAQEGTANIDKSTRQKLIEDKLAEREQGLLNQEQVIKATGKETVEKRLTLNDHVRDLVEIYRNLNAHKARLNKMKETLESKKVSNTTSTNNEKAARFIAKLDNILKDGSSLSKKITETQTRLEIIKAAFVPKAEDDVFDDAVDTLVSPTQGTEYPRTRSVSIASEDSDYEDASDQGPVSPTQATENSRTRSISIASEDSDYEDAASNLVDAAAATSAVGNTSFTARPDQDTTPRQNDTSKWKWYDYFWE